MAGEKNTRAGLKKSSVRWRSLLLLTAAAAGGGMALVRSEIVRGQSPLAPAAPAPAEVSQLPEVATRVVAAGALDRAIRVTGTLKSSEVVKVSTKAAGLVQQIYAEEGDRVRAGQLLARIDDRELQAQRSRALSSVRAARANVESAEASARVARAKLSQAGTTKTVKDASAESQYHQAQQELAAAQSRLAQAKATAGIEDTQSETRVAAARSALQSAKERLKALQEGSRRQETAQAQAAVQQAQAQMQKHKSMFLRRRQLLAEGYLSREEAENSQRDYEVALANLNAAKQQLDLVQEGPRSEEVRVGEEGVRQAEASLRDAEANRARRSISNEDIVAAEAQVRQAQAAVSAAKAGLGQREISSEEIRSARAAVSQAEAAVSQARAAVGQAQAEVRNLDAQISQTRIYSPVNAVISERKAHVGESVSAMNSDLMTLVASDSVYLEATAPETSLPYLKKGAPAAVTLDAAPGRTFPGSIREIIPVSGSESRTVRLRIGVPGSHTGVVGGFARATIQGGAQTPVVTVPRAALVSDQGQDYVFVLQEGKVQRRSVQVGLNSGRAIEVRQGLRIGEEIVTEDASRLTDGEPVTRRQ